MSKYIILYKLKDALWRNLSANATLNKLKSITTLYVYDTPFAKFINDELPSCTTVEALFDLINTIIYAEIDKDCYAIGGLAKNKSSVTYQLMHLRPLFVDMFYSYQKEDLVVVLSSFIVMTLEKYVGHGISQDYFNNFKNKLYACESYDEIIEFVDSTIDGGKAYVTGSAN